MIDFENNWTLTTPSDVLALANWLSLQSAVDV